MLVIFSGSLFAQHDTIVVQTFTFDSTSRNAQFVFPTDDPNSYEKILMQYRMRCRNGEINTTGGNDVACGEWDYSCNTYILDSSMVDSVRNRTDKYIFSGAENQASLNIANEIAYDIYRREQTTASLTPPNSHSTYTNFNTSSGNESGSFGKTGSNGAMYFKYSAADLSALGLQPGNIDALTLETQFTDNVNLSNLSIEIATAPSPFSVESIKSSSFQTVYNANTPVVNSSGNKEVLELLFTQPYSWDGTSDLVIKLSHNQVRSSSESLKLSSKNATSESFEIVNDRSALLNSGNYIEISSYKGIMGNSARTCEAWIKTDSEDTQGEICAWGSNAAQKKWVFRLNVDGTLRVEVNGGYKFGTTNLRDGKWHHVACVFDGTDVMDVQLYVDGQLESVGGEASQAVLTASGVPFRVSYGVNNRYFEGNVDNVRVWEAALTPSTLQEWAYKAIANDHPNYSDLAVNFNFNQNASAQITNSGAMGVSDASVVGGVYFEGFRKNNLIKEFAATNYKPVIGFYQGVNNRSLSTEIVEDSVKKAPIILVEREVVSKTGTENDAITNVSVEEVYSFDDEIIIYDTDGSIYDIIDMTQKEFLQNEDLFYWTRMPSKVEIMSFVTPYGINLDLGMQGKMWEFDVSDFATVLTGNKQMSLERGGQTQEEMDIRFLFIKGTPERNITSFNQIWRVNQTSYAQIAANNEYQPVDIPIPADAKFGQIRSVITGHGQEGEFLPRQHYVDINSGAKRFSWDVWTECSENPIYPQGGTWLNDRAGWCPGAPSDLNLFDISSYIAPGSTVKVDYGLSAATGDSRYIVNHQLVTYGDYNFGKDAAVEYIIKPSNKTEFDRFNASCTQPEVSIKNRGSEAITALSINYWVNPDQKKTYNWSGTIAPSNKQVIVLPNNSMDFWNGASGNRFHVEIVTVNGGADEYANNNTYSTSFTAAPVYSERLNLNYRTNSRGSESAYKVYDIEGNVVLQKSGLSNNTTYTDFLDFAPGCYQLEFTDSGDDGLYYWYYRAIGQDRGTGFLRLRKTSGASIKTFEPEFGGTITHDFVYDQASSVTEKLPEHALNIFPNPSVDGVFTLYHADVLQLDDIISITDMYGKEIFTTSVNSLARNQQIDLSQLNAGMFICKILRGSEVISVERISKL